MTTDTVPDAITQAEKIADHVAAALTKYAVAYSHVTLADFSTAARTWSVHETGHGNPFVHDVWLGRFDNKAEADALATKLCREEAVEAVRRLAAHGAAEGVREAAVEAIIAAIEAEHAKSMSKPRYGAWHRGRRYGLMDAVRIVRPFLHSLPDLSFTSPADAGSTTLSGGAEEANALLRKELNAAADQFAFYADEHAKKGIPDGDAKGATNMAWARRLARAALPSSEAPANRQEGGKVADKQHGFGEDHSRIYGDNYGDRSVKRSHRGEGRNYVD